MSMRRYGLSAEAARAGGVNAQVMRVSVFFSIAALVLAVGSAPPARAASAAMTRFEGLSISPDGRYVADVQAQQSDDEARNPAQHLFVRDTTTGAAREIPLPCGTSDGCAVTVPAWSKDSSTIAYVVHAAKSRRRLVDIAKIAAGPILPTALVPFAGTIDGLRFSDDGKRLAALAIPNAKKEVGATQAGAAIVGEIGAAPDEQRIVVIPLASPSISFASPATLFVYQYDWIPDGSGFVGTAAPGDGDNNWWIARLFRFDVANAAATEIYRPSSPQQQLASPRVSPDGKTVAFIGGIMSDFGSTGGDLYALPLGSPSAVPVDLTANAASTVTSFAWGCHDDSLVYARLDGANQELARTASDGALAAATASTLSSESADFSSGAEDFSAACDAGTGARYASTRQTFESPPEIVVSTGGVPFWKPLTHLNAGVPREATAQSLTWTSDGFTVQGWLLRPLHTAPGAKLDLITNVHGGPAAANTPRFVGRGTNRDLLRHGYGVFLPNPRGSFGQGEAFTLANVKDFGYGDLRDILSGIDAAEKLDPTIDDAHLGITGGSYGGYMTMWAVTQTHRFKAAVAAAGVSDWLSYYGENGIDEWMIPYFGASVYDDPAVYAKSAPITFIKNVTTPTFALVGERDVECPAPQSLEFWHALVAEHVPTSLVIYPGEGHRLRSSADIADATRRSLAWFDRYLKTR